MRISHTAMQRDLIRCGLCCIMVVVCLSGCGGSLTERSWPYKLSDVNGEATLVLNGNVRIVFKGESYGNGEAHGQIMIAGIGTQNGTMMSGDFDMAISYFTGLTTINVGKHEILIQDGGRTISFADEGCDIDDEHKVTLTINANDSGSFKTEKTE